MLTLSLYLLSAIGAWLALCGVCEIILICREWMRGVR